MEVIKFEPKEEEDVQSFDTQHLVTQDRIKEETNHDPANIKQENQFFYGGNIEKEESESSHEDSVQMCTHIKRSNGYLNCEECNFKSKSKHYLRKHIKRHLNIDYNCGHCNFKAKAKEYLRKHIKRHLNISYKCEQCNFKAKSKDYIQQHRKTHSNLYYNCDQCDYKTKWKSALKRHSSVHTNIYYNCDRCDFKTKVKHYVQKHIRTHLSAE